MRSRDPTQIWRTVFWLPLNNHLKQSDRWMGPMGLAEQFTSIDASWPLFLRRLRRLVVTNLISNKEVEVNRLCDEHSSNLTTASEVIMEVSRRPTSQYVPECEQTDPLVARSKTIWMVVDEKLTKFSRQISGTKEDPNYKDGIESKLSLAFPLESSEDLTYDENKQLEQKYWDVFAYLPIRSFGFRFVLQADFDLPGSREDVSSTPWNEQLRQCVPSLFIKSVHSLRDRFAGSPQQQMSFLKHLPRMGEVVGFFASTTRAIHLGLKSEKCLLSERNEWIFPSQAVYLPPSGPLTSAVKRCVPGEILEETLGKSYLHPEIVHLIEPDVAQALSISGLSTRVVLGLLSMVYSDSGKKSEMVSQLRNDPKWVRSLLVVVDIVAEELVGFELKALFGELQKIPFLLTSDGRLVAPNTTVVVMCDTDDDAPPLDLLKCSVATLSMVPSCVFSTGNQKSARALVGADVIASDDHQLEDFRVKRSLVRLGVRPFNHKVACRDIILPILTSAGAMKLEPHQLVSITAYLAKSWSAKTVTLSAPEFRQLSILLNTGEVTSLARTEEIHLSETFGESKAAITMFGLLGMTPLSPNEAYFHQGGLDGAVWTSFFQAMGLINTLHVQRVSYILHPGGKVTDASLETHHGAGFPCQQVLESINAALFAGTTPQNAPVIIEDYTSKEFDTICHRMRQSDPSLWLAQCKAVLESLEAIWPQLKNHLRAVALPSSASPEMPQIPSCLQSHFRFQLSGTEWLYGATLVPKNGHEWSFSDSEAKPLPSLNVASALCLPTENILQVVGPLTNYVAPAIIPKLMNEHGEASEMGLTIGCRTRCDLDVAVEALMYWAHSHLAGKGAYSEDWLLKWTERVFFFLAGKAAESSDSLRCRGLTLPALFNSLPLLPCKCNGKKGILALPASQVFWVAPAHTGALFETQSLSQTFGWDPTATTTAALKSFFVSVVEIGLEPSVEQCITATKKFKGVESGHLDTLVPERPSGNCVSKRLNQFISILSHLWDTAQQHPDTSDSDKLHELFMWCRQRSILPAVKHTRDEDGVYRKCWGRLSRTHPLITIETFEGVKLAAELQPPCATLWTGFEESTSYVSLVRHLGARDILEATSFRVNAKDGVKVPSLKRRIFELINGHLARYMFTNRFERYHESLWDTTFSQQLIDLQVVVSSELSVDSECGGSHSQSDVGAHMSRGGPYPVLYVKSQPGVSPTDVPFTHELLGEVTKLMQGQQDIVMVNFLAVVNAAKHTNASPNEMEELMTRQHLPVVPLSAHCWDTPPARSPGNGCRWSTTAVDWDQTIRDMVANEDATNNESTELQQPIVANRQGDAISETMECDDESDGSSRELSRAAHAVALRQPQKQPSQTHQQTGCNRQRDFSGTELKIDNWDELRKTVIPKERAQAPNEGDDLAFRGNLQKAETVGRQAELIVTKKLESDFAQEIAGGTCKIVWLNAQVESWRPYDIIIEREGNMDYIEVKASGAVGKAHFEISYNEWKAARMMKDRYHIYRISGVGRREAPPNITVFTNPYKQWMDSKISMWLRY
eukprot:GHVN01031618.1.p1 GENE.GHVN01031618.1~~GHVN01031618.1.p1  ORF type:complete len:1538 (-),score=162.11 GHVN01031618.1:2656-7269(-)